MVNKDVYAEHKYLRVSNGISIVFIFHFVAERYTSFKNPAYMQSKWLTFLIPFSVLKQKQVNLQKQLPCP